ncbi:hypothetical protein [Prescottella equi]|uniref:hypothetical protein n=1 Tax=Rhodococcus hoagii TaxID=43767 RepID=UPI000A11B627|nr:hypothetical protein [Prescottella equi]ORL30435.1 hypothetical protein A6I91_21090 [Prescottella equi]
MTSNEVAPLSEADILPAGASLARTPDSSTAVAQLMQHAEAMNVAYELADKMCGTSLVPAIYRGKPEDGTAAILYGAELGLNPIQSLQQIFVVHGMPAIYARTMVALMKSKGHKVWTVESSDESVTVAAQRENESHIETSTWTIERARQAGYIPEVDERTGKLKTNDRGKLIGNEKYLKDPQAMLYAKAASEVCRKIAPDVLLGIAYTREELELEYPEPVRAKAERVTAGPKRGMAGLADSLGVGAASDSSAEPEPAQVSASEPVEKVDTAADSAPAETLCTRAQQQKLAILLDNEKVGDRQAKLDYLEGQFGRKFASSKELTKVEASRLIEFLEEAQAADAMKAGDAASVEERAVDAVEAEVRQ